MDEREYLGQEFEANRTHLRAVLDLTVLDD